LIGGLSSILTGLVGGVSMVGGFVGVALFVVVGSLFVVMCRRVVVRCGFLVVLRCLFAH